MWIGFLVFFSLSAILALLGSEPSERVARIEVPEAGPTLVPPVPGGDLESRLSQIASVSPGDYGVAVFDARSERSVEVSAGRSFEAASLAKLPVLLALYREAATGSLELDEEIHLQAADVTDEGAGVLHKYPVGTRMTLRECARFLIKESDNTAWLMLERRLGKERISAELDALGLKSSDYVSRTTSPKDTLLMLRAISDPEYTTPDLSKDMLAMMTGTAYEDRIPEPLPESVRVAHKVGTLGETHSDAGIVFEDDSPEDGYYIVVISAGAEEEAAEVAIRRMSLAAYESLRSGKPEPLDAPPG